MDGGRGNMLLCKERERPCVFQSKVDMIYNGSVYTRRAQHRCTRQGDDIVYIMLYYITDLLIKLYIINIIRRAQHCGARQGGDIIYII